MTEVILNVVEDSYGTIGLSIDGVKMFEDFSAATDGALIAHDLLEHMQGVESIGSIGDELIALGACWFVRGENNNISRRPSYYSPQQNIASDVTRMANYVLMSGVPLRQSLDETFDVSDYDDIVEIGNIARRAYISEYLGDIRNEGIKLSQLKAYFNASVNLMVQGYKLAEKKYDCQYAVGDLFWNIADTVGTIVNYIEFAGQQFILTYDNETSSIDEYYPEDEWDEAA